MICCNHIDSYIRYAEDHPEWINTKREKLIENLVKPLLRRKDVYLNEQQLQDCIAYCEKNYYPLFPYQKFIYAFAFLYWKKTDIPVFRKFVIEMGRGNGKDGFIVPLVNFFQTPLYGVRNYHIELVANSEAQIRDTFNVAYNMLSGNPKFQGHFQVRKELITNLDTGSEMKFNTSNASTKDGKRPGCLVMNELHAYENYDQINVFESALGKVKHPREFVITTNGYVRGGPLDDLLDVCTKILENGDLTLGIFPFLCMLDSIDEVKAQGITIDQVMVNMHKANPSQEFMPILESEIRAQYLEAQALPSKWKEFLTKRCNLPEKLTEHAVTSWENILRACYKDIDLKIPRDTPDTKGKLAIIGIDYADVRDFASAGVLTMSDEGTYIWRQHSWICSQSPVFDGIKFPIQNVGMPEFGDFEVTHEPVIPVRAIIKWCLDRMEEYTVVKITLDTYRYSLFREMFEEEGISIESKNNPSGTVRLVRRLGSATGVIAPSIEKAFSEGMIDFGQSAIMRWYTNNTAAVQDKYGNYQFTKIEPERRKTDGFFAFVVAFFSASLLKEQVIYV